MLSKGVNNSPVGLKRDLLPPSFSKHKNGLKNRIIAFKIVYFNAFSKTS